MSYAVGVCLLAVLSGAAPARAAAVGGDPRPAARPTGVWPLAGEVRVVRRFDLPAQRWGAGHRGADLLATENAPVRASMSGVVSFAGVLAGRGVVVVAHADGTRTTYEPVAASTPVGARVAEGGLLGRLTAAGSHCLPSACLHWGWRRGETYLDPLSLVRGGPVRLLPVWSSARGDPVGVAATSPAQRGGGSSPRTSPGPVVLVAAGSAGSSVLAGAAVAAALRRRRQSRAGSSRARRL